jgi:anti-anti-sigma factor
MFEITKKDNNIVIVKVNFNIDMENFNNVVKLKDSITNLIEDIENPVVILDLENCDFIDSTGLGNVLRIFENIRRKKGKLMAVGLSEHVKDLFDITTVNKLIECHLTVDDALKGL